LGGDRLRRTVDPASRRCLKRFFHFVG
jgi:hypothetical protein